MYIFAFRVSRLPSPTTRGSLNLASPLLFSGNCNVPTARGNYIIFKLRISENAILYSYMLKPFPRLYNIIIYYTTLAAVFTLIRMLYIVLLSDSVCLCDGWGQSALCWMWGCGIRTLKLSLYRISKNQQ